jgi:multicomponent K+:H+ antiporter subunit F
MLNLAITLALAMLGAAFALNFYRLLRGPDLPDRILALDTLYINGIGLLILLNIRFQTTVYFEAALLIAVTGFLGTIAVAKYLLRGDIIE